LPCISRAAAGANAQYGGTSKPWRWNRAGTICSRSFGERLDVTLSTHLDTVPPSSPSRETTRFILGTRLCDAKGIIAADDSRGQALLESGERNSEFSWWGEERNSAGAFQPLRTPRGVAVTSSNGEPTENKLRSVPGALRYELVAAGQDGPLAYPELGDSRIHKLVDALALMPRDCAPVHPAARRQHFEHRHIHGGRAPNVIADEAKAEILIAWWGDSTKTKQAWSSAAEGRAELREVIEIPGHPPQTAGRHPTPWSRSPPIFRR